MKALVYGADRTMVWRDDAPRPEPRRGHYLIRVIAAGLNPFDEKLLDVAPMRRDTPVGMELAGRIEHAPRGAEFKAGDLVMAHTLRTGALAELVNTPVQSVAALPTGADPIAAAALPHAGATALAGLIQFAGAERALIIARPGASVPSPSRSPRPSVPDTSPPSPQPPTPTSRPNSAPTSPALTTPQTSRYPTTPDLLRAVASQNTPLRIERRGYRLLIANATTTDLQRLSSWLADAHITPRIAARVPFVETELRGAYEQLRTRRTVRKVVVAVDRSAPA